MPRKTPLPADCYLFRFRASLAAFSRLAPRRLATVVGCHCFLWRVLTFMALSRRDISAIVSPSALNRWILANVSASPGSSHKVFGPRVFLCGVALLFGRPADGVHSIVRIGPFFSRTRATLHVLHRRRKGRDHSCKTRQSRKFASERGRFPAQ